MNMRSDVHNENLAGICEISLHTKYRRCYLLQDNGDALIAKDACAMGLVSHYPMKCVEQNRGYC